ncbi:BCCT family transporter [Rhodovibrionaceae bacterium A322]
MKFNPLLAVALLITGGIALWGIIDTQGLTEVAKHLVALQFNSRAWFIMLTVSFMLLVTIGVAVTPIGNIRLGKDDERPEFSTLSWLTMLFAAGMGVGLLYWGTAEPLTHYRLISTYNEPLEAGYIALFLTNFHWGLHAWAIYALTALVMAYFAFRRGEKMLVSVPLRSVFGDNRYTRVVGWLSDLAAIVAIAIGLGGSIAMGVFQVKDGLDALTGTSSGFGLTLSIFAVLVLAYLVPLTVDLSRGMALLSNAAMAIAGVLMAYLLLVGPTSFIMGTTLQAMGEYIFEVIPQGFRTFTLLDQKVTNWFQSWTLTYMVWWLAWAPFVGVFIARISRGRTIREFVTGVLLMPTGFSILWFGVFGSLGFYSAGKEGSQILEVVTNQVSSTTFYVLQHFPLTWLTTTLMMIAVFLFIVTSVVSAAFVLGMFSTDGNLNPSSKVKLSWGAVLGALGMVMILSGSIDAVKSIIALGALPFVFIVLLLVVSFLKALKKEAQ